MISAPKTANISRAYGAISPSKMLKIFSAQLFKFASTNQQKQAPKCPNFPAAEGGQGVPLFSLFFWKSYFFWGAISFEDFRPNVAKKSGVPI